MVHEISQFDISDRQLLAVNAQPRAGMRSDIGEAKITRTIFGKAKVSVIREQDKKRRAWLLTALVVMALATAAWQWWVISQEVEPLEPPPLPLSQRIRVSAPVFQPEEAALPATQPSSKRRPKTQTEIVIGGMLTRRPPPPQPLSGSKVAGQAAVKQVKPQPLTTSKPQTPSLSTNDDTPINSSMNQADMQQFPEMSDPMRQEAVETSPVTQDIAPAVAIDSAVQSAADIPATVAPLAEPLAKDNSLTQSSASDKQQPLVDNQQADPVTGQP
jgi:hypothetical protein